MSQSMFETVAFEDNNQLSALFYQKIFDDFPALIWLSGQDSLCWYFNKNWLAFRGRSMEQEVGVGWAEGVHPDDFDFCLKHYMEHFNAHKSFSMEYRLLNAAGEYRWILDLGMPFFSVDNVFQGFIGSCYDVTEEKNMIVHLEAARKEALEALEQRTKLLSYVSHEIRSPLNILYGYVQLLAMNDYDEETNDIIRQMSSSGALVLQLIDNLLDLSKYESRQIQVHRQVVSVEHLVSEIENIYKSKIESGGVQFHVHIGHTVPLTIISDEMKLIQIISNLISNAVKFTQTGYIRLGIDYEEATTHLILQIEDTGIGINRAKQHQLFEAYEQGDPSIYKLYGGTGLGLNIVKSLVDLLQGTIEVDTVEGRGTRFTLKVPLVDPENG